jgi:glycosyltransferase involved in cell wall biosynthesis
MRYHDYHERAVVDSIAPKCDVLYPGIDLHRFDGAPRSSQRGPITILWNSRWDYDKQPLVFFAAMEELIARGADIRLIVLGEYVDQGNVAFNAFHDRLAPYALHWGYVADADAYRDWLHRADIVVSCAIQEFFGIAVIEAAYCGAVPVLPRRLAYPELLPAPFHDLLLYKDDPALATHLERVIAAYHNIDRPAIRAWAAQYDWQRVIGRYDRLIGGDGEEEKE